MKNRIIMLVMAIVIVAVSTITPLISLATDEETITNNAYNDFSSTNNPNGVWSYESRVYDDTTQKYNYSLLAYESGVWGSVDLGTAITTITSCMESHTNALHVLASNDTVTETVLTYTAPESGTIVISMENGGVFSTTRNTAGLIRFSLLKNDTELTGISNLSNKENITSPFFATPITTVVKKGDVIRFVVGKNENKGGKIYTDFLPQITYANIEKPMAKEFSAAEEFTAEKVEGQWRYYGYDPKTAQFQKLNVNPTFWGTAANCSVGKGNDLITGKPVITMHSGVSLDPTLAFVAPYTGKLNITMNNGGIFAPNSGYDGVIFTLRLNDEIISTEKINSANNYEGYRVFADKKEFSVTAGDIIYFSFNQNTNTRGDTICLDPHIEYTETVGEYDSTLRFLDDDVISYSNLYKDSFDISWPAARGGIGEYDYYLYLSKTPITGIPNSEGIKVEKGRKYSFSELEGGTAYYVAVVATDGTSKALLTNENPISTISKLFVFNAYEDFKAENMASPWSYEVKTSGAKSYEKLTWDSKGVWGNTVSHGYVTTAITDMVTGKPAILLEPYAGSTLSLTYTAPYTGTIDLSLVNGGIMVPYNGAGNKWDGINFSLTKNDEVIEKFDAVTAANAHNSSVGAMYKGRLFTDKKQIEVKAGDVIRFTVDQNKSFGNDKTYINPEIIYTQVAEGSLNLHFEDGKIIKGENITDTEMTVVVPSAFGGTGKNEYTLYYSTSPISSVPTSGGINLGEKTSYTLKDLTPYTNYYFAATVFDGENTASLILTQPISTIGNTYLFDANNDWSSEGQPINTPWRYCLQSIKDATITNLNWNSEQKVFVGDKKSPSASVSNDVNNPVTGGKGLKLHPDTEYNIVVLFTAPFTGNITLDSSIGGVFTPYNGGAQKYDGINFSVLLNGESLYSKTAVSGSNNHNDRCFSAPISTQVKRGDVIHFVINKNANVNADTTFINPRVAYTFVEQGSDVFAFWPDASFSNDNITANSFDLSWSSAMGPDGAAVKYSVWLSTSPITSKPTTSPMYSGKETTFKCTGLSIGTRYYAYIEAVDKNNAVAVLNPDKYVKTESPIYNANKEFNLENGAGVWNYTVREKDPKTGEYRYKLLNSDKNGVYGTTAKGSIAKADFDLVVGSNVVKLHPGAKGEAPVLVFTAPYSGEIQISMINGGVFCPNNGALQNFDGVAFEVLKNDESLIRFDCVSSKNNPEKDRLFTKPITTKVKQGDKIYFVVEANKNQAGDLTLFNPQIEFLNVTGGSGKITELSGFVAADEVAQNANDLTTVKYRDNDVVEATKATGYKYVPEEENVDIDIATIIFFATIGCTVLAIAFLGVSFIVTKKGGKR